MYKKMLIINSVKEFARDGIILRTEEGPLCRESFNLDAIKLIDITIPGENTYEYA